jgi:hypothetical protein
MDNAFYGFIGTILGALVSLLGLYLTSKTQFKLRLMEWERMDFQCHETRKIELINLKREKFCNFLSAYWVTEAYVLKIIDELQAARNNWRESISSIFNLTIYIDAIKTLNESLGWISILCDDPKIINATLDLSSKFDKLVDEIKLQIDKSEISSEIIMEQILYNAKELRQCTENVSQMLRNDLKF